MLGMLGLGGLSLLPRPAAGQLVIRRPILVWLGSGTLTGAKRFVGFLLEGLAELGYRDGDNFELLVRMAENDASRLPALAGEALRANPAVIIAGAVDAALAAHKATSTVPIVSDALADADHLGLVSSYARPGGNVTGITPYIGGLPAKQIEVARTIVPNARQIGLIGNMNDPKAPPQRVEMAKVAESLGARVVVPEMQSSADLAKVIGDLKSANVDVVVVLQTTMLLSLRKPIAEQLAAARLPAVYGYREHVDEGGLISYGIDLRWCWRRVASFVDRILKGAVPGELPVEFPPKVQMVVNTKAASGLGLTLPQTVLIRADEVIE